MQFKSIIKKSVDRKGAMLPMVAVVMVILLFSVAIGVDVARMHVTRSELRTANDAAARAAVVEIGLTQEAGAAKDAAILAASRNIVAGRSLTLNRDQIAVGTAEKNESGKFEFIEGGLPLTTVRVEGSRSSESPDGEVALFFGPIFGVDSFAADAVSTATETHRDIALVLDVSGSMKGSRFEALGEALDSFLVALESTPQTERVSLTVYSAEARKIQPLTADLSKISAAFDEEKTLSSTAIGLGMARGLDSVLNDPNGRPHSLKSMIVMTDGRHNTGITPEEIAPDCVAAGVSVFTVTFEVRTSIERMRAIAESSGGFHIHADGAAELEEAFETIAKTLGVTLIE